MFLRLAAPPEHGAHPGDQLAGGERLGHVVVGAQFQADDLVDLAVLGGQHDHRHVRPLAQRPADLAARQPGQHQVEQHQVRPVPVEGLDRVRAGRADRDLEALLAQHVGERVAERFLVLDDEHACHLTASLAGCAAVAGLPGRSLRPSRDGQPQGEGGPLALLAPDRDLAAVRGGHVLDDGQPQPGPAGGAGPGRVDPVEALEDPLQVPLRDADALVRDADLGGVLSRPGWSRPPPGSSPGCRRPRSPAGSAAR